MATPSKLKIYNKKGNYSYKEKRMIDDLKEAIMKKIEKDPLFENDFKSANDFASLKEMHEKYCAQEVSYQEVSTGKDTPAGSDRPVSPEPENEPAVKVQPSDPGEMPDIDDPFNAEEPIVRDYVLKDEFGGGKAGENTAGPARTTFDEPTTFADSFSMPDDDMGENNKPGDNKSGQGTNSERPTGNTPKPNKPEPLNPSFDDMGTAKKRKNSKKFAKYIVEAVCMLSEKGFVWFANKDINDAKLAEYEIEETMDLNIMLTMNDDQQATVRQFFQLKCMQAEQLAIIPQQQKDDLSEALADVMMEKGVAPTPMQELAMVGIAIFGRQALSLMMLKSETNGVLNQLKAMRAEEIATIERQRKRVATPPAQPIRQEPPKPEPVASAPVVEQEHNNESTTPVSNETTAPPKSNPDSEKGSKKKVKSTEPKKDNLGIITTPAETIE